MLILTVNALQLVRSNSRRFMPSQSAVQFLRCGVLKKIQSRFPYGGGAFRDATSRFQLPSSTPTPSPSPTTGHTLPLSSFFSSYSRANSLAFVHHWSISGKRKRQGYLLLPAFFSR